jgi:hypothetical protein
MVRKESKKREQERKKEKKRMKNIWRERKRDTRGRGKIIRRGWVVVH